MVNHLQDQFLSACRSVSSTETALIKITDHILHALDTRNSTALIMTDMLPAFDTSDHNILLDRLSYCFGVKNSKLTCFLSYLCNRSHRVVVNNIVSSSYELSPGVPRGSVLGHILVIN